MDINAILADAIRALHTFMKASRMNVVKKKDCDEVINTAEAFASAFIGACNAADIINPNTIKLWLDASACLRTSPASIYVGPMYEIVCRAAASVDKAILATTNVKK
jgi:predicted ATPase